ncbi:hypothetical protein DUG79_13190 [Vibrio parahaemolyticus]|nr:hypothetical protein [Vibrio parahaemolyticus]
MLRSDDRFLLCTSLAPFVCLRQCILCGFLSCERCRKQHHLQT